jgi:hypothetical protein
MKRSSSSCRCPEVGLLAVLADCSISCEDMRKVRRDITSIMSGIPDPNQGSDPASGHRHRLRTGYLVVKALVPGGLHHPVQPDKGGRLTSILVFADDKSETDNIGFPFAERPLIP